MFQSDACALIIGIDDYTAFDPSGASNLPGSVNDARAVRRSCDGIGMSPENVRVLTSSLPGHASTGGSADAEASEAAIRDGLRWLAERVAAGRKGLLWYSGHGAYTKDEHLLLCPSDTTGSGFEHAIPFASLRAIFEAHRSELTVVLDCCHGGPTMSARGGRVSTLGGDPVPTELPDADLDVGAVVLAACAPGEQTQQSSFMGVAHGAFTWALLSVADQWVAEQQGRNVAIEMTYRDLVKRTTALLAALDFTGTPQVYPQSAGRLAVMQSGDGRLKTSGAPNATRAKAQLDPSTKTTGYRLYTWKDGAGSRVARTVVPVTAMDFSSSGGNNYEKDSTKEYWIIEKDGAPATLDWVDFDKWDATDPLGSKASFINKRVTLGNEGFKELTDGDKANYGIFVDWNVTTKAGTLTWIATRAQSATPYLPAVEKGSAYLTTPRSQPIAAPYVGGFGGA